MFVISILKKLQAVGFSPLHSPLQQAEMKKNHGTVGYASPEMLKGAAGIFFSMLSFGGATARTPYLSRHP